jgi:2'-5' RNA ligase
VPGFPVVKRRPRSNHIPVRRVGALIIEAPTAEPVIGRIRRWLDSGRSGMPAHITVLYPFLRPDELDELHKEILRDLFARTVRFKFQIIDVGWFGDRTVFLTVEPEEPFKELTAAVFERFPEHPPYGGAFNDVDPHVTVASRGRVAMLRRVARHVSRRLPIAGEAIEVVQMVNEHDGTWRAAAVFPLSRARAGQAGAEK